MKLNDILKKENNNIDIFRVIAACLVIWGHAYVISPEVGKSDFITYLLPHDTSGSIAVKIFFFLSGLVVTNSILTTNSPIKFIASRFFRIWPALFFTCIICAYIIGPIVSTLPLKEYFNPENRIYLYVFNNISMITQYNLPGVFLDNPHPISVNGSLWTIPYEVYAYIILLCLFCIGIYKKPLLVAFLAVAITFESVSKIKIVFFSTPSNPEVPMLAACFAFGSVLAAYKNVISITLKTFISLWILYILLIDNPYSMYLSYAAIFIAILYLSKTNTLLKIKPKSDISYGVYLWGFPVQQIIAMYFLNKGVLFNQILSIFICIVLGWASWHLVEKRFINLGKLVGNRLSGK
ncbi:acyltransferase family protein [Escherichia coli]|uniref:acyltransferase family protein n=1 Tax=Escherichia coli TaxID=562 RepID=UPI000DA47E54|nr:acyltransferase [Escherichia coli]SQP05755.1 Fucose 4-O-acetylase and related acetyltransferases [Escherichia coli]SQP68138.1 Fucose 4-O-acetylase and related acetyltransferases [Escherichia coli]SQZ56188.1 Fucose 4-O-acetylase and related acetyltransferases [Escherichia coli]SQZ90394.1 Fucose 4-O-acetylase and related acetyltransferases [Escherichia coli]